MMYTNYWTQEAEDGLATAWLGAEDRKAITIASHIVDWAAPPGIRSDMAQHACRP